MPETKTSKNRWQALLPVLNDHNAWFHELLAYVFYSENRSSDKALQKPTSFAIWFLDASRDPHFQSEVIGKLNALHKELMSHADRLVREVDGASGQKPSYKTFQTCLSHFDEFCVNIRRLEQDFMTDNSGYDPLTGLRNPKLLESDIAREQERLGRQGKSFTIAMARLDHYSDILKHYSKQEAESFIKLVSELIKLSIRSFDDAYYLGDDRFVFVLKQSEIRGGVSALERLRRELERQDIFYTFGKETQRMSMSCCIAAPNDTDDISDLLKNLEADLRKNTERATDTVLQYFELSPLQRFVRDTAAH